MGIRWNRVADTCVPLTFSMGIGLHPRAGGMSRSLHPRGRDVEVEKAAWGLEIPSCQTPFPATTASGTAAGGCSRCSVPNICETAVGEF